MPEVYTALIRILALRENSAYELRDKLSRKGFAHQAIDEALIRAIEQGLQSDARFSESFCRLRISQGYGPVKIRQDLLQKGIEEELIESTLVVHSETWSDLALSVLRKKFKSAAMVSFQETQKMKRFLQYRGFSTHVIHQTVRVYE